MCMKENGRLLWPVLAAVLGNAFWGFSFLFTRTALQETTPEIMLAIRFAISFALMNIPLLLGRQTLRLKGKRLLPLWGLAVAEPLVFFAESYGILHTNATFAGVMTAIAPLFAIALAALILKEYPSRRRTYMVLLSCLLVFVPSALLSVKGDWGAVVAPLTNPRVIFPVTALCILCSIAANMLVNYAAGRMSVAKLSVFGSLITLCSTFGGIVILREPFSPLSLLGTALIIYGVWQVSRPETDKAT